MAKKSKFIESSDNKIVLSNEKLFVDLSELIEQSREQVAMQANSTLTILFWQIGKRINDDILKKQRAEYGKQIVQTVSVQLETSYGRNFTEKNVRRMMQFAEVFSDLQIVVTLSRQLTWSHFLVLIPLKSVEAKQFYAQLTINEKLGVRKLANKLQIKTLNELKLQIYKLAKTKTSQLIHSKIHIY